MTCHDFEQWLDKGMPEADATAARAHAAACALCTSMLAAAREIEGLLPADWRERPANLSRERIQAFNTRAS